VLDLAKRLQTKLNAMDPASNRDTLVWAHGFLIGIDPLHGVFKLQVEEDHG
jgi:hypothetical protein